MELKKSSCKLNPRFKFFFISACSPGILPTNRGNFLVARLIEHRYPLDKGLDATAWKMALLKYVAMPESKRPPIDSGELNEYEKRAVRLVNIFKSI